VKPLLCKWIGLLALLVSSIAGAQDDLIPVHIELADNLRNEGKAAQQACVPLLLEFSSTICSYCDLLEEEILKPILRNRSYEQRVRIRKVLLDSYRILRDFDGRRTNGEKLAQRYRVFVTPTLLFVDQQGEELAERMVGVTTLELYGGYLDQAIDQAGQKLCR
jgi:thioredoxin-related protein